jgi:hypothetical protein
MALEGVMQVDYPAYVEVPRDIEQKAYVWSEFARGDEQADQGGEANKFVGGKIFLVKFGSSRLDPIWPIDIFEPQVGDAQIILGSMLADAIVGFPVPHYPRCLQKAHENAALVDFGFDILQDYIYEGVRGSLGVQAPTLDARSMDAYRLFIYSDDGQLIGPAKIIHAANDTEAIAQAEVVRGSLAAELLDIEGLRIVKYLPGNGGAPAPKAAE